MDNLDVTSSQFGTDSLVATGTEYYPSDSQAQIVNNTGYNYHYPHRLVSFYSSPQTVAGSSSNGTKVSNKGYSLAASCLVQCRLYHIATGAEFTSGTVTFSIDGTLLYTHAASSIWAGTTAEFEGTISLATDGWRGAEYTSSVVVVGLGDGTVTANFPQVFLRGI